MAETRKLSELTVVNRFFDGYKRLTCRFNNGWKGEDHHVYVGQFRILKVKKVIKLNKDTSNGEADGRICTVWAPKWVSGKDVINALAEEFTWSCRCEHDCCGHLFSGVLSIRRTKKREWLVEQVRRYNV